MPDDDPQERLELVPPSLALADAFLELVADFDAAGQLDRLDRAAPRTREDFPAYLRRLDEFARGVNLPIGSVPENVLWLVRDGTTVLGRVGLRHTLTPALEDVGGHIGYAIRPSARRRGYGTRILALALERARALGLELVLVTCDSDNIASARIIEKNGGLLASRSFSPLSQTEVSRYWIAL